MNVLLANDGSLDRGGISVFMLQWIKALRKMDAGCGIHVYFRDSIKDEEFSCQFSDLGTILHMGGIPRSTSFKNAAARKKIREDIDRIIQTHHINVIHINSGVFGFNTDLLSLAERRGVPVRVSHSHGAYDEPLIDKVIHSVLRSRIRTLATAYAGCSRKAGEYLFGISGMKHNKWNWIPNTVQVDRFVFDEKIRNDYREQFGIQKELLLGTVGNLHDVKNHTFLLDVLKQLAQDGVPAKLLIIGEGEEREKLENKIQSLGLQREVFLPGKRTDIPECLSAMDLFLLPSKSEGFPISAVEAQANGLNCLLSDRISGEIAVAENVWMLSIDKGVEEWVSKIKELKRLPETERLKGLETVKKAGLDQDDTNKYIRKLYGQ